MALTLLRCVGWLSRDDIAWRPGHAGPPCQTPGAQCLGIHTFEYSVVPHGGDWSEIEHLAHEYVTPCEVFSVGPSLLHQHRASSFGAGGLLPQKVPDSFGLVSLSPPQLVLSTVKMAEDSDDLIIRLYNPTSSELRGEIQFHLPFRSVELVNLDEKLTKPLNVSSPIIPVEVKAKEILTFKIVR